ncbi:LIC_10190 family membrane protein, partial [Flavobacterium bizetiae]
ESYYIQTIKWINEYGFIKGLANLHLFLGQTSGWHVTQSVFNFSFLYKNFNDLSGYCLLLGTFFSIQKLNDFYTTNNRNYLVVGLLPLFNIFLFQFISAPSPDVPVYIFSIILFFYFLENFKKPTPEVFYLIVILVLFLVYIKNTMLTFGIIPIILLTLHFKIFSKKLLIPILLTTLVISLFIIKNMIICGSPIFPSKSFNNLSMVYAIPDAIENFYYDSIKHYGYAVTAQQYNSMSSFHLFLKWLTLPKLHGLFNSLIIFLIILVPFFIYKFQNKKSLWILYIVMVLQLVLLFMTSPQYRFFMNFILFFSLFCFACLIQNKKIINSLLALSQVPVIIVLFISVNFNGFSNNTFMQKSSNFSISNIVFPHTNTKNNTNFITVKLGNLNYNSPINNDFFWGNGDGALPCVNKDQIEYFKKYFNTVPQMRTNDLKDGFYAKKLSGNE